MRSVSVVRLAVALGLLCGVVPAMHGAVRDRIVGGEGAKGVAVAQSVSPRLSQANGLRDLGVADEATSLGTMTLRFNMTEAQKAALSQLLIDQQNPASSKYHQWLTPEQYAARFGLSSGDMATVTRWLTAQGFTVTSVARSRTFIQFTGTVAQAQAAFSTSIHRVSVDVDGKAEEHLANMTDAVLPSGIAGVVASVGGLNDFRLKPRARVRQVQGPATSDAKFTSSISGNTYIAPGDFYTIYDVKPLLTSSINGTGLTIAVAGQTDIALSDIAAFRSASGLSANPPTVKVYGSDPGTSTTDEPEADLDVEWSGAVAPGASILYVNSTDVIGTSLTQIIDNKLAQIASISYGDCESNIGSTDLNALNTLFMQANAEGMTVVGPTGDTGATDCDYQATVATQGLAVDFPASSPYVTALGGTQFNEGSGSYFAATNDANGGSAISYIPEAVWNETAADGALGAGGGGVSAFFTKPYWQTGNGVPNDFSRDTPDVSLNASAAHDGYLFCSQGSCVNGFRASATPTSSCTTGNCLDVVGGTSVSTPAFAGILALVEQKIGSTTGIGNANPTIYALANSTYYGSAFHDVTVGNNASPCTAGSTDCPSGGSIGYDATTGYDLATGWGSVDAFNLASSWTLVTPVATGGIGTQISTTTLTSSGSLSSGATVTLTATVVNGGTASGVQAPTGTVQFLVDNVVSGSAVTLVGGSATYSLSTTALVTGDHTVTAAYSGDAVYAGSKASLFTPDDFTLTPATATVTTKSGTDAAGVVFTVTPQNGFKGNITFTATTRDSLNATPNFTVNPVVIASSAAGTTTFVLSAYVTNAKSGNALLKLGTGGAAALGKRPAWFAGSGAMLACLILLVSPKRHRFGSLLGVMLAIGALGGMIGMSGCGSGSSTVAATTNTTPGTYTITVTATAVNASGGQSTQNATVTFVVQ